MSSRDKAFEAIVYNVNVLRGDLSQRLYECARAMCAVAVSRSPHGRIVLYGLVAMPDRLMLEHHEDNVAVLHEADGQKSASCCPAVCRQLAAVTSNMQMLLPTAASIAHQEGRPATMADFCIGIDALTHGWAAGERYTGEVPMVREVAAELANRGHRIANPVLRSFMRAHDYVGTPN